MKSPKRSFTVPYFTRFLEAQHGADDQDALARVHGGALPERMTKKYPSDSDEVGYIKPIKPIRPVRPIKPLLPPNFGVAVTLKYPSDSDELAS